MAVALVVVARDVMGRRSLDRAVIQAVIVQGHHQDAAATNIACVARLGTRPGRECHSKAKCEEQAHVAEDDEHTLMLAHNMGITTFEISHRQAPSVPPC
jgi:hypothetical protein